jgi:hypothetical protein
MLPSSSQDSPTQSIGAAVPFFKEIADWQENAVSVIEWHSKSSAVLEEWIISISRSYEERAGCPLDSSVFLG